MNRKQMIDLLASRGITVEDTITDIELASRMADSIAPVEAVPAHRASIQVGIERSLGADTERQRASSILAAGRQYNEPELAQAAVESGQSLDQFRHALLDKVDTRNRSVSDSNRPIGLSKNEAQSFSFLKLMRALSAAPEESRKFTESAKFELEACEAARSQITHRATSGCVIPIDAMLSGPRNRGQRGQDIVSMKTGVGYTGSAGATMQTSLLAGSFIDVLYNKTTIMRLGTELSGLLGNVDIPKQISGTAAYWLGEDDAGTREDIRFGLVQLQPKTVAYIGQTTRKSLVQSSISMEAQFRNTLAVGLGLEIDRAGFYGLGTAVQPRGVKLLAGINTANWTAANAPTYAELIAMESVIAAGNADVDTMSYVMNPGMRGYLKTTQKFANTNGMPIWEPGNTVNGYATEVTNQIATGDVFFANWADLLIGMFGGLELLVDPYSFSNTGAIRYTGFQDIDFAHRMTSSFCFRRNV